MNNQIGRPLPFFNDLEGNALDRGYIYIGMPLTNPVTNPMTVYQDVAQSIPMKQPLRTIEGMIALNGSPLSVYPASPNYSITVLDHKGRVVVSQMSAGDFFQLAYTGTIPRTYDDVLSEQISVANWGARYTQNGSTNTTLIQKALNALSGGNVDLWFYEPLDIAGTLELPPGVNLRFGNDASLTAVSAMGPMVQTPLGTFVKNSGIYGGSFYCNNLANTAVDLQWFSAFNIQNFYFQDWLTDGIIAGNAAAATYSDGLQMERVNTHRPTSAIPAGSRVIYLRAAGDNELSNVVPVGGEIGVQADSSANVFAFVHPWSPVSGGLMKQAFILNGDDDYFTGCYADTPSLQGWQLNGNNYNLVNCRAFNNGAVADLAAVGMDFTSNDPRSSVLGFQCSSIDSTHRFSIDIQASATAYQSLTILGNYGYNFAAKAPANNPSPYSYGTNVSEGGFRADGPPGSNARGFVITTNGVVRWVIRSDNSSEPVDGSNTGCNLQIDRYSDTGVQLGQPIWIQRQYGVVQMTDSAINLAGVYTKPLYLGAYAFWVDANGELRIKNGAPTSDLDGATVGSQP